MFTTAEPWNEIYKQQKFIGPSGKDPHIYRWQIQFSKISFFFFLNNWWMILLFFCK